MRGYIPLRSSFLLIIRKGWGEIPPPLRRIGYKLKK